MDTAQILGCILAPPLFLLICWLIVPVMSCLSLHIVGFIFSTLGTPLNTNQIIAIMIYQAIALSSFNSSKSTSS